MFGFFLSKFWPIINGNANVDESAEATQKLITVNTTVGQTRNTIVMQTASVNLKVLPTTKLYFEKKYQDCKHIVKTEVELPVEMVNMTKEDLAEKYPDWGVKEFSEERVVLYKVVEGLCDEHFVINDENGKVVVYKLDKDYNKKLYEKTDIYTEYLPTEDINRLKEGIYVYTVSNLNSELENLE